MEVIKNYKDDAGLRASFNRLAEKTFGLNFEKWYQNGYWQEKYNPYSIVIDGEIVANVSVNVMDMLLDGEIKHLIQLGTVMTDEKYRNRGLIREIMNAIDADYAGKAAGMYLWANDSVVTFYPKFGFESSLEYRYSQEVIIKNQATIKQIPMNTKADWKVLEEAIAGNRCHGRLDMVKNIELFMFYITQFMQESVYYEEVLDAYVIGEIEDQELLVHGVFAKQEVPLDRIIRAFGENIRKVTLGFTPADTTGYVCEEIQEEDRNFFVKGKMFGDFAERKLMFPLLSHA